MSATIICCAMHGVFLLECAERVAPESDKYALPFTLPFLPCTDFVVQTINPNGSVYSPLMSMSRPLVASTVRASAISASSYVDVRVDQVRCCLWAPLKQPTSCVPEEVQGESRSAQTSIIFFC